MSETLTIPANFDHAAAESLAQTARLALEAGGGVTVAAENCERVSTLGLQTLAAVIAQAQARDVAITLKASDVVRDAAARLGLSDRLGLTD